MQIRMIQLGIAFNDQTKEYFKDVCTSAVVPMVWVDAIVVVDAPTRGRRLRLDSFIIRMD